MRILPLLFICASLASCSSMRKGGSADEIQVSKIWDEAPHSAFTELVRFKDAFYCSFREGTGHKPPGADGKARVIRSTDGVKWESVALLEKSGLDLRDPKISVTPDNRIMMIIGGSDYDRNERTKLLGLYPHVSFSDENGANFSAPEKVTIDPAIASNRDWIWKVTWHKGVGYGIDYPNKVIDLMRTTTGKSFDRVSRLDVDGYPNESAIRFDSQDNMYVLVRREEGDKMGVLAKSAPPYKDWTYTKLSVRLGGPNFIFYDGKIIIGSRLYTADGDFTGLRITDMQGNILKTITLPSKGDTSYPGLVIHEGKLWMTYYSSHEGKTSIYLAKIPLSKLKV